MLNFGLWELQKAIKNNKTRRLSSFTIKKKDCTALVDQFEATIIKKKQGLTINFDHTN